VRPAISIIGIALSATLLAACGGAGASRSDGATGSPDMAQAGPPDLAAPDFSVPHDLAPPSDLTTPDLAIPDLATPDLARPDLKSIDDGGHVGICPPNGGYVGIGGMGFGQCGLIGLCNGHTYALDCDGVNCVCSVDKAPTAKYAQQAKTCGNGNLMNDWTLICGF
jgi:hypothetical protein